MRILSKATLAIIKIIRIFAFHFKMVHVVQLVERQIVVLVVVGSSPTSHPTYGGLQEACNPLFSGYAVCVRGRGSYTGEDM